MMQLTKSVKRVSSISLLYLALLLAVAFPVIYPLGLPAPVSASTKVFYNVLQSIPEGSLVIWCNVMDGGTYGTLANTGIVLSKIMCKQHLKFILVHFHPAAPGYWSTMVGDAVKQYNYKYGEDYAILPFLPGIETAIAAFVTNIQGVFPFDIYNTPTTNLKVLQGVNTINDAALVMAQYANAPEVESFVRQVYGKMNKKFLVFTKTAAVPVMMPYYKPDEGPVIGWISGTEGGLDLELLSGIKGEGLIVSDAKNIAYLFVFGIIAAGNVVYFRSKGKKPTVSSKEEEKL